MTEALIILLNMRGGCATVGDTVHTLFRVTSRGPRRIDAREKSAAHESTKTSSALAAGEASLG